MVSAVKLLYAEQKKQEKHHPAFIVYKLEGEYPVNVIEYERKKDKKGNDVAGKRIMRTEMRPRGFLVRFPKVGQNAAHPAEVHIATQEELIAEGFGGPEIPKVDEDGIAIGETIPNIIQPESVLKSKRGASQHA